MRQQQPTTTHGRAERHEALWLGLSALHRDIVALAAKKPLAPVSEPVRIAAETLLSECVPFLPLPRMRLPVAAPDLAGLAVQLGQALAGLDAWESRHSFWNGKTNCRAWRIPGDDVPVLRLRPQVPPPPTLHGGGDLRAALVKRMDRQRSIDFEKGFRAGSALRHGGVLDEIAAEAKKTYPHIRLLD